MPLNSRTRIIFVNPVGNSDDDQTFADMAKAYRHPGTAVEVVSLNPASAPSVMTNLEYRAYEALIVADIVKAARQAANEGFDAMAIGCFYDPALAAAREIAGEMAVVAPCQASIAQALTIANNFSVIIGQPKWAEQMRESIARYGHADRLASFEPLNLRVDTLQADPERTAGLMRDAGRRAVSSHHAESIILGCTMEIGFHQELQSVLSEEADGSNIPVIDCSIAVLKAAEHAAWAKQLGWTNSRAWGMAAPPEEELRRFDLFQAPYEFGNRIQLPAEETTP